MTAAKRTQDALFALGQLTLIAVIILFPDTGLPLVTAVIQIFLCFCGIQYIVYYFTMARYMVDGKAMLYKGGLYLNFSIFVGFTKTTPPAYIMVYLIGYFLLRSVYRGFHVLQRFLIGDRLWISAAVSAAMYFSLAVFGMLHLRNERMMVYLFCVDVGLSAVNRIARVIKKTAIAYIP